MSGSWRLESAIPGRFFQACGIFAISVAVALAVGAAVVSGGPTWWWLFDWPCDAITVWFGCSMIRSGFRDIRSSREHRRIMEGYRTESERIARFNQQRGKAGLS